MIVRWQVNSEVDPVDTLLKRSLEVTNHGVAIWIIIFEVWCMWYSCLISQGFSLHFYSRKTCISLVSFDLFFCGRCNLVCYMKTCPVQYCHLLIYPYISTLWFSSTYLYEKRHNMVTIIILPYLYNIRKLLSSIGCFLVMCFQNILLIGSVGTLQSLCIPNI